MSCAGAQYFVHLRIKIPLPFIDSAMNSEASLRTYFHNSCDVFAVFFPSPFFILHLSLVPIQSWRRRTKEERTL